MGRKPPAERVIEQWLERDLTAAARELPPAFDLDEPIRLATDILDSGRH